MPGQIRSLVFSLMSALLLLAAGSPAAAELVPLLSFPDPSVRAGQELEFRMYFHNEGHEVATLSLPHQLQLLITADDGTSRQVSAFSLSGETVASLAPGSFRKKTYALTLPRDLQGPLHYSVSGYPGCEGLLLAEAAAAGGTNGTVATLPEEKAAEQGLSRENLETLYQTYAANFSAYRPTYFLAGTSPEKSKFQISFKYRLFNPSGSLSRKYRWLDGFHLGYTQTSFWDLDSDSAPFEDTSYKPEIFYQTGNLPFKPSWMDSLSVQLGAQHESNGRAGDFSRSTNYVYAKPEFIFYHRASQLGMLISPRVFAYFNNNESTNPDFADYRGHFELAAAFGRANSLTLATRTRFAEEGTSVQADLSYPIHRLLGDNFDIYLHIQYSNALAESLIRYQDRVEALRIGFSLVR